MKTEKRTNKRFIITICMILLMIGTVIAFSSDNGYAASKKLPTPRVSAINNIDSEIVEIKWSKVKNTKNTIYIEHIV